MAQFQPGSSHSAKVTMTNPTSGAFDYSAILYMGVNKAAMAEEAFHLNAGESKEVTFAVVMPTTEGEYPVYISVFSGEALLGHYQSIEDVVIAKLGLPFDINITGFSIGSKVGTHAHTLNVAAKIRNPHSVTVTHNITCCGARAEAPTDDLDSLLWYCSRLWSQTYTAELPLTLAPGQEITIVSPGRAVHPTNPHAATANTPYFYYAKTEWGYFYFRDENGNESQTAIYYG